MVFYSFVLGYGASLALGYESGELTQAVGGAVLAVGDLGFRKVRHGARWSQPASGGTLFFLPAFVFGVLWSVVGGYDVIMYW